MERENPDPLDAYWKALIDRVFDPARGLSSLSKAEKVYFAVNSLTGEVYNGGFDQYFWNSASSHCKLAAEGLGLLEANTSLAYLESACHAVFLDAPVPSDTGQRREFLRALGNDGMLPPAITAQLEALDAAFWKNPDGLSERLRQFALANHFIA